ncbi:MAG: MaoC family dehydratase [Proteobacteria bacterium]|nr:MaoC family dehydratase [Pseudomonadota bacterium]
MLECVSLDEMKKRVGSPLGQSDWLTIDQDRINRFADCTGDHQWIHVDEEKAAQGPFGKTIAHGFLILSLIPQFSFEHGLVPEGATMAINYGLNKVRFVNPVPVGSRIRDVMTLTGVEEKAGRVLVATTHTLELEGSDKPACIAETLAMFFL